ncbi:ribosomal protein L37AE/L43A [Gracilibacillus halotolerans]|uniref:Ribosomal protein L37AE/L43A n=1 Tax=Gracilibacillus halotolerans TaxID=74386 RepID=A0A841RP43_9BACI|nr:nuclease-related domain-containing protein [Gracilibacillus halotolerans]MBB6513647.1 ribosomal protein L37AE/L43A [Gracilibacillus halotolerans]
MILKEKTEPESLIRLRRLVTRLQDPSPYLHELRNREQGYKYECQLQFFLDRILYQYRSIIILHDIRIPIKRTSFQMDCLLLTPNFGLIIETKGLSGKMSFTQNGQFFHYDKGEIYNPISQVIEQRDRLSDFLSLDNYQFEYVVCLGNPSVSLSTDSSSEWVLDRVIPFDQLKDFIGRLFKKYPQPLIEKNRMINIGKYLKSSHKDDLHRFYNISSSIVEPGVICPECFRLRMERTRYRWRCMHCGHISKDAHLEDILDWFSMINHVKITNSECKFFLAIDSSRTATTLLKNCERLSLVDKKRWSYYILK